MLMVILLSLSRPRKLLLEASVRFPLFQVIYKMNYHRSTILPLTRFWNSRLMNLRCLILSNRMILRLQLRLMILRIMLQAGSTED
ncbi:hypothetical protein KR49_13965 [Synechococcus sp. KORDI-49]|nr:hypothetical protein KR49_13965 [Synechococcus sp. KORDI-49]